MTGEYVRREDTPGGESREPTGEDGVHGVKPSEHQSTDPTAEEREERRRKQVEGGTGDGPVNEDNSEQGQYGDA